MNSAFVGYDMIGPLKNVINEVQLETASEQIFICMQIECISRRNVCTFSLS